MISYICPTLLAAGRTCHKHQLNFDLYEHKSLVKASITLFITAVDPTKSPRTGGSDEVVI